MNDRRPDSIDGAPIPDCLSEMLFDLTRAPLAAFPAAGLDEWIGIASELISRLPKLATQRAWINLIARGLAAKDRSKEGLVRSILIDRVATAGQAYLAWREEHAPVPSETKP